MGPAMPRILLIDDDAAVRGALQFMLELEGYKVEAFESAEAFAASGRATAGGTRRCLVVDYHLPGLDGLSLVMILHDLGIHIPTVVLTSDPSHRVREGAAILGAAVVEKPLLSDELSNAIRAALGSRARPAPVRAAA